MAREPFVCHLCQKGRCDKCIDIINVILDRKLVCKCTRRDHSGEPRDKQILDPTTGEVFAPGLKVTEDGEVKFSE